MRHLKSHEAYYYLTKERYEVDCLSKDRTGRLHLYQVVWDNSDANTMERETRALNSAEQELGITGKIIMPLEYVTRQWSNA